MAAVAKARVSWLQVPVHSRRRVLVLVMNADGRRQVRFPKSARLWRKAGRASSQRMSPRRGASAQAAPTIVQTVRSHASTTSLFQ